jgi:hypothetical protein
MVVIDGFLGLGTAPEVVRIKAWAIMRWGLGWAPRGGGEMLPNPGLVIPQGIA